MKIIKCFYEGMFRINTYSHRRRGENEKIIRNYLKMLLTIVYRVISVSGSDDTIYFKFGRAGKQIVRLWF